MTRWVLRFALACGLAIATSCAPARADGLCWTGLVTAYLRYGGGSHTADGTPVGEAYRAAAVDWQSWIPFGAVLDIEGLGPRTVRDTGYLAAYGVEVDVMVETLEEAWDVTGRREICLR